LITEEEMLAAVELLAEVLGESDAGVVAGEDFVFVDGDGGCEAEGAGGVEGGDGEMGVLWWLDGELAYFVYGAQGLEDGLREVFGGVRLPTLERGLDGDALGEEEGVGSELRDEVEHDGELGFVLEGSLHGFGEDQVKGGAGG